MATRDITSAEFNDVISSNDIVIIDFWAEWCGPCKSFAPTYEKVSDTHEDIVFAKVDTEQEQELAAHFQIRSIPTLMVFREEVVLFAQPGMLNEGQLEEMITKIKSVDMAEVHKEVAQQEQQQS